MSITYRKFSFKISPFKIGSEILVAQLEFLGFDGFEETDEGIDAFIINDKFQKHILNKLQILSNPDFEISYSSKKIIQKNWNYIWESSFKPIKINKDCGVRANFHSPLNLKYEIIITPKMSFGTGHHQTTSMMMKYIMENNFKDLKVLDVGCGTGILGILSEKVGASLVDAIDIEKWCYENTIENTKLNNCNYINAYCGDIYSIKKSKYDIILANINKNTIIDDIFTYNNLLVAGGQLIISGFYVNDFIEINKKVKSLKLKFVSKKIKNLWVAVHYIKN